MRASRFALLSVAAALFTSAACVTPPAYDPFKLAEPELRAKIDTIALAPLRVSSLLASPAEARARIEPLLKAKLEQGGFKVVESSAFDALWRAASDSVGGVYDAKTGKLDKERFELVEDAVYHEIATRHGADAILYTHVSEEELLLPGRSFWFCGTKGEMYWEGSYPTFELPLSARAACLNTTLYDLEERELYAIRSGIVTTETYAAQTVSRRPRGEILRDAVALQNAVNATLGRLAGEKPKK